MRLNGLVTTVRAQRGWKDLGVGMHVITNCWMKLFFFPLEKKKELWGSRFTLLLQVVRKDRSLTVYGISGGGIMYNCELHTYMGWKQLLMIT